MSNFRTEECKRFPSFNPNNIAKQVATRRFATVPCSMNWAIRWSVAAVICLCAGSVFGDLANELQGYWSFDEVSGGVVNDFSGHGHNGDLVNFSGNQGSWASGQIGGALLFGGPTSNQYVCVPNFAMPSSSMTLTAWVWANSAPPGSVVANTFLNGRWGSFLFLTVGNSDCMSVYVADAYVQQGGVNVNSGKSSAILSLNQWHFLAFVADSQTRSVTIMQDGVATGSFDYSGQLIASTSTLEIGGISAGPNPNQGTWDGKIDDLAIWARALSPQELTSIYNAGLVGNPLWTLVPKLSVVKSADGTSLQWPASMTNYALEVSTSLTPPVIWTAVTNSLNNTGKMRSVLVNPQSVGGFFRLRGL